jgi:hypothetical protein
VARDSLPLDWTTVVDEANPANARNPRTAYSLALFDLAQSKQRLPKLRRKECWKRPSFRGFDAHRMNTGGFRLFTHAVKKHSFPNSAQAYEHCTFGWAPDPCSFERRPESGAEFIAARQLRGWSAGARCKWVPNWPALPRSAKVRESAASSSPSLSDGNSPT